MAGYYPSRSHSQSLSESSSRGRNDSHANSARDERVVSRAPRDRHTTVDREVRYDDLASNQARNPNRTNASYSRPRQNNRPERSRSRSPWRPDKSTGGEKRYREEDHYGNGSSNSRRSRRDDRRSGRRDPPAQRSNGPRRDRSRSPWRPNRAGGDRPPSRDTNRLNTSRGNANGAVATPAVDAERRSQDRRPLQRQAFIPASQQQQQKQPQQEDNRTVAQPSQSQHPKEDRSAERPGSSQSNPEASGTASESNEASEAAPKLSDAEIIEQRRKKRAAIKAKHTASAPLLVQALEHSVPTSGATPMQADSGLSSNPHSPPSALDSPSTPRDTSSPGSPATFAFTNDEELVNVHQVGESIDADGPSAADYDPNMDMNEDRPDHKQQDDSASKPHDHVNGVAAPEPPEVSKKPKELDMFAEDDDDFDMFAAEDTQGPVAASTKARALDENLLDNWDYPDGHYRIIPAELLDSRYSIKGQIGKGTFATVVRATDIESGQDVAIKIARNNDTMYKAGMKEVAFLELLNEKDQEDKKHIIRLHRYFNHKNHLCLVFENLSNDLREVLKKFGRNVGINLAAIKAYARQMFLSLAHMKSCSVLHADLKPDNILVNEKRNALKICDLGTATFQRDAEITPYLVSRFYRAPEIILGIEFDYGIDMWSIGCTLYELYTGRILFPGSNNNNMLRVIQECRGKFPNRLIKKASLAGQFFDENYTFYSQERDKITDKIVERPLHFLKIEPGKDIRARVFANSAKMTQAELKDLQAFADLLEKCLQLDPDKRITPKDAQKHPFVYTPERSTHTTTAGPMKTAFTPANTARAAK